MAHETGRVPDLAEMANRLAIMEVLAQHSRGVDRADAEVMKSAYWPEAEVAYGGYNGPAHGFCDILPGAISSWGATHHQLGNINIRFDGDEARVETYVSANHYQRTGGPAGDMMMYVGRYLDRMQRRGNVWKIMFRRVVMDWNLDVSATANLEGPGVGALTRGGRSPSDASYTDFTPR